MTVLDLVSSSLRLIGTLAQGQNPNADEAEACRVKLNNLLERWSLERLNLFNIGFTPYALTPNKQTYTVGVGASDFNSARPVKIQTASIIMPGTSVRIAMDLMTSAQWAALREKASTGLVPTGLYCDYDFPIAKFNVAPVPTNSISMELYSWSALPVFLTLQDVINLPQGYADALDYNLAVKIAPEFGMALDPVVVAAAADGKAAIQRFNALNLLGPMGEASREEIPTVGLSAQNPTQQT